MSKIDFSKIESALSNTLQKIYISQIAELATIATLVNTPVTSLSQPKIDEALNKLKTEILYLKEHDLKLYDRLKITPSEEKLIFSSKSLKPTGWARLGKLKNRINALKKELYGEMNNDPEIENQIELERKKHINKRFNVRENWLPLH